MANITTSNQSGLSVSAQSQSFTQQNSAQYEYGHGIMFVRDLSRSSALVNVYIHKEEALFQCSEPYGI